MGNATEFASVVTQSTSCEYSGSDGNNIARADQYVRGRLQKMLSLAKQFRELAKLFHQFTRHSNEPITSIRQSVDNDLAWQAGRDLCEVFDHGLLDHPGFDVRHQSDVRHLSPVWCKSRLETLQARQKTARRSGQPDPGPADPGLMKLLQDVVDTYQSSHVDELEQIDQFVIRICWWGYIKKELADCESYKTRLGTSLPKHWPFIETLIEQDITLTEVKPFAGDTSEDRIRLRLQSSARVQEVACEIVAEILESYASIEQKDLYGLDQGADGSRSTSSSLRPVHADILRTPLSVADQPASNLDELLRQFEPVVRDATVARTSESHSKQPDPPNGDSGNNDAVQNGAQSGQENLALPLNPSNGDQSDAEILAKAKLQCMPAEFKAWLAEQYAIRMHGQFRRLQDTYDWLEKHFEGDEEDISQDLRGYTLPAFTTWSRQVRAVRNVTDTQINHKRAVRACGKSIVKKSQI